MKPNTIFRAVTGIVVMAFSTACLANTILDTTTSLLQNDPIQWGRISRNGESQNWTGSEPFGGIVYQEWQFHYHTYKIPAATLSLGRYVQINLDDLGLQQGNVFASAYANSYDPTSLSTNWLGDAGTSGNFFGGTSPVFFQVLVPAAADLIIVVWNTDPYAGLGVGEQFRLIAEQFKDVAFTDAVSQPLGPTINIQTSAAQIKEGQKAVLTLTASPAPTVKTNVNFSTGNSAVLGKDYTLSGTQTPKPGQPGYVTFLPGQTAATVTLKALKDNDNVNETATINVQNGASYLVGPNNSASVAILEH